MHYSLSSISQVKRTFTKVYLVVCMFMISTVSLAHDQIPLVDLVKQSKASIVSVALYTPLESRTPSILGTGFVVGNGQYIVTNYHVVAKELDSKLVQYYVALSGEGKSPKINRMTLIDSDPVHDLAILKIENTLPAMTLAGDEFAQPGTSIVMTGYPIGAVLGLYPATHTGIIAAIAPDANPARNADELTLKMLERLQEPFLIYQLDITAFPGNSGSPIYDRNSGQVLGVLNKVFVSAGKEAALSSPSGISYAIPVRQVKALAKKNNITL
ncbi:MAG: serine protease Do [Kangiellaceae bacterium]|jgi:serine protease Do